MCGIFGIIYTNNKRTVDRQLVIAATNLMQHRGPDDCGFYVVGNIGLGHRRLSIIDLESGHQPMANESDDIVLVYNGEIYNHHELREQLVKFGHIFKTNCDTEVIIHAYEQWGVESASKFNGMFAFGLWDKKAHNLWIVRDRLGIKPLYYFANADVFIFSSEIKPLLKTGLIHAELNEEVLDAYFTLGYVPGPQTIFKHIQKLKPGHFLTLRSGQLQEKEYWDFASIETSSLNFHDAQTQLNDLLQDSINKRLMSDVPLGAFLSGGIDSSTVVALMSHFSEEPVNTFTVTYERHFGINEDHYAQMVAERFQTNHHLFQLTPDNFFSSIRTLLDFAEEPIVDPAAIALYHIARLARKQAIVILSGEGGDEIFAGYYLYYLMQWIENIRKLLPHSILQMFPYFSKLTPGLKFQKYADWLALPIENRYQGISNHLTASIKKEFYTDDFYKSRGSYLEQIFSSYFARLDPNADSIKKMLYIDTKTWLVDDLLLKADKMTMAASVELRVPFLDYRIVEFSASLKSNYKIVQKEGKYILKNLMKDRLPHQIISRRKMGFPVPTKAWFNQDLIREVEKCLLDHQLLKSGFLNRRFIEKIIKQHKNQAADHSWLIFSLLVLQTWFETYPKKAS